MQLPRKVYPRVGGGTPSFLMDLARRLGLSPRGRGNPQLQGASPAPLGSIPAWAGEPHTLGLPSDVRRVYPRVGGGTRHCAIRQAAGLGLSPRGRGNRILGHQTPHQSGSIPAWAGAL